MRNRFTLFLVLVAALLVALPVMAQEQTGGIDGTVKDAEGSVLPGVTVEATANGVGTLVANTDARGTYRFPRLPSSVYTVKASLEGYKPAEAKGIALSLGQILTVNLTLEVGSFEETIVVTGEGAQIDVTQSATTTSISREQIAFIPKGRDFTSVVTQAAGASDEAMLGGISVDGASGSENRFVIDGIETTHPQDGTSGQPLITDFIEEVQVKSAGYAAEYGGALGGVVNVVTKSGTNDFDGSIGAYMTDRSWGGDERISAYESAPGNYRQFQEDDEVRLEPGLSLGGPIVRDKAWFYFAYMPAITETERTPDGVSNTFTQDTTVNYFAANVKGNVGSKFLYKASGNLSPAEVDGVLPARDGSTPADTNLGITTDTPRESYSAYADFIPSSNFYVSGRVGLYKTDISTEGVTALARFFFRNGVMPVSQSDPRFRPTGFSSVPAGSFETVEQDLWERESASIDGNLFFTGGGAHALKGGVQYENISNEVGRFLENGNLYEIRWGLPDRLGLGVIGTYGSVHVRRFGTVGAAESENLGLYLQDAWQVLPNLSINIGVRTEEEKVPNFGAARDASLPENAIEFDFEDKLAPRFGFSWDVLSDQRWKVYGSYGTYYDITKLEMPRGSFGADQWIGYAYPLNTLDWETLDDSCHISTNDITDNVCPGLGPSANRDLRAPTDPRTAIDPDLQPMENREIQIGMDHQLTLNSVVGVRYVNKELINTIEDIGYLVYNPDGTSEEHYITGNPGKGLVAGDPAGPIPPQAEAVRDYEAIELSWNRRFADNWSLRASYTYSSLEGNYSGLASSDEFGRTDPNVARYFDGLAYGYDQNANFVEGPLNTDRPNAVEAQFLYRMPWGTNLGLNSRWAEGGPISEVGSFNGVEFFPRGRETHGRLDDITQTDLLLAHPFRIGNYTLEASINVINMFDEDAVTQVENQRFRVDVCDVDPACDGTNAYYFEDLVPYDYETLMENAHASEDPFFLRPLAFQAPRTVRVGLKFAF